MTIWYNYQSGVGASRTKKRVKYTKFTAQILTNNWYNKTPNTK